MPPSACDNRPWRAVLASVNAPRAWPNSSHSISVSGIAPQSTAMNGPAARSDCWWSERATISLPVPDCAGDQHGRVGRADLLDHVVDLLHRRARADEVLEPASLGDDAAQPRDLGAQVAALGGALDRERERREIDGLGDEVVGARAHRADRGLEVAAAR